MKNPTDKSSPESVPDGDPHPDPAHQPPTTGLPLDSRNLPAVIHDVDTNQIKQFVTQIKSAEQQIGEHILTALLDDGTVAVLTAVVVWADGGQRIVSAALDPNMLQQVQQLLADAQTQRDEEIPCIGFHCLLKRKESFAPQKREVKEDQ